MAKNVNDYEYPVFNDVLEGMESKTSTKPSGGGGSEPFVVTFTEDGRTGNVSCDKTYAEIMAAFNAGQVIIAHTNCYQMGGMRALDNRVNFYLTYEGGTEAGALTCINIVVYTISSTNVITVHTYSKSLT